MQRRLHGGGVLPTVRPERVEGRFFSCSLARRKPLQRPRPRLGEIRMRLAPRISRGKIHPRIERRPPNLPAPLQRPQESQCPARRLATACSSPSLLGEGDHRTKVRWWRGFWFSHATEARSGAGGTGSTAGSVPDSIRDGGGVSGSLMRPLLTHMVVCRKAIYADLRLSRLAWRCSTSPMRVCQPGPPALKWPITSRGSRSVTCCLGSSPTVGRPRTE